MSKVPFYFTKYHRGLLIFPAKDQTEYLFKIVSTTGTLLLLVTLNIKNTGIVCFRRNTNEIFFFFQFLKINQSEFRHDMSNMFANRHCQHAKEKEKEMQKMLFK